MKKLNIAIFFGGCSSEYHVSLESAEAVVRSLNTELYQPVLVGISKTGEWYCFRGDPEKIGKDCWLNETDCVPAVLSPKSHGRGLLLLEKGEVKRILVDAALPVMHGKFGEDGTIQGMIEMAGIPLVGCGVLASALCMDKERAHKLARAFGIAVPESIVLKADDNKDTWSPAGSRMKQVLEFCKKVGYPVFVKPLRAGSSFGITKVTEEDKLWEALALAFQYDDHAVLEEGIEGFEVGCAVLGCDDLTVGEVDEIQLSQGFFDFKEKYSLETSSIHVPARVEPEVSCRIKETAKTLYRALGCAVFARVDMFLTPEGNIIFNEINTIPGFTEHSRYPGMMRAAGVEFPELLDRMIRLAVKE